MIKYRYAKGSVQSIVDVHDLTPEQRHDLAPYFCFGCGRELVPNLGQKKVKHFSHKSADSCSGETYLHQLAKNAFMEKYSQCLTKEIPYIFKSAFPATCNHFKNETGQLCKTEKIVKVDLTKHFKRISLEKSYAGFIPDILLSTVDGSEVLFVEIAVTHKCEENKINSGKRIIEIEVVDDSDVAQILGGSLIESSQGIRTYNFNKKRIVGDICNGECEREVDLFIIYESKKSILLELPPFEALKAVRSGKINYSEILGFSLNDRDSHRKIYKDKVREAHFNKRPIKNCFLCRYHGADGIENAIFCKFRKESVGSNEAAVCEYYRAFLNMKECREADIANVEYANNSVPWLPRLPF